MALDWAQTMFGGFASPLGLYVIKVARDEKNLRVLHSNIVSFLRNGGVPAGLIVNYSQAAASTNQDILNIVTLLARDNPDLPQPILLPNFQFNTQPADRSSIVTSADVTVLQPSNWKAGMGENPKGFGFPVLALIIGATIVVTASIVSYAAVKYSEESNLAQQIYQRNQEKRFDSFIAASDKAFGMADACQRRATSPDQIIACWKQIVGTLPQIKDALPDVNPPDETSWVWWVGLGTVLIGAGAVGFWGWKRWRASKHGGYHLPSHHSTRFLTDEGE